MKNILFCIIATLSLQGCLYASKVSQMNNLVLPKDNITISAENVSKIESDLTRGEDFKCFFCSAPTIIEVVPYTKPLIYAMVKEEIYKKHLEGAREKEYIDLEMDKYTKGKQYFRMMITAPSYPKIQAEYINGHLIDSTGQSFPIHIEMGVKSTLTSVNTYNTLGYVNRNYYYQGPSITSFGLTTIAAFLFYVDTEMDFSKPFKINLDMRHDKNIKPFTLEWKVE